LCKASQLEYEAADEEASSQQTKRLAVPYDDESKLWRLPCRRVGGADAFDDRKAP